MSKILFGGYLQGLTVFNPFFSAAFQKTPSVTDPWCFLIPAEP